MTGKITMLCLAAGKKKVEVIVPYNIFLKPEFKKVIFIGLNLIGLSPNIFA